MQASKLLGVLVFFPGTLIAVLVPSVMPVTMAGVIAWLVWLTGAVLILISTAEALELVELLRFRATGASSVLQPTQLKPFVSLHVPVCAEPPEVVIRTLVVLRDLKYDAYEVLVVDNNTPDEQLWRPVEAFCRGLGPRFRFYHLPQWPGFKAGALNFALQQTSPEATIIGVIDADYEVAPNYLSDLVEHFANEQVGFVQTPQNYRDWRASRFFRMCYWEYWQFFAVGMVLRNHRNAILLHGTMSLIRKDALVRVDGWAEWCLTEDSELGLRLLAAGYRGMYVLRTYGRGLMPFSYHAYKRQRRRWVTGGVQTLMRHWRFFLPWSSRGSHLRLMQKLHYLQGWLPWCRDGVMVSLVPPVTALHLAVLYGSLDLDHLAPLWVGIGIVVLHAVVRQVLIYHVYLARPWSETLGATVAILGLTWTVGTAWLLAWLGVERVFHRTPKRPEAMPRWVAGVRPELLIGTAMLLLGLALLGRFGVQSLGTVAALSAYALLLWASVWTARIASGEL
jgi:GT2 family glycosyltransferase